MPEPKAPAPKAVADAIDAKLVRKLADILSDTGLTEIEVEQGELRIRVAREITYAAAPAADAAPAAKVHAGEVIKSPMVGTVYMQPQPGDDPFIKVGQTVAAGQTLLIIEAMKTMNPIPSPRAGKVVEILVADSTPVEFGEPLVVIE